MYTDFITALAEIYTVFRRGHVGSEQQPVLDKMAATLDATLGKPVSGLTDAEILALSAPEPAPKRKEKGE